MKRPDPPAVHPVPAHDDVPARDDPAEPSATQGPMVAWAAEAVPDLPAGFTEAVMAEATGHGLAGAFSAWSEHAVPALPEGFADAVLAEASADGLEGAFAAWSAHAVPTLPPGFADAVVAEATGHGLEGAFAAWSEHAVPALPPGFADAVAARVEAAKVTALPARSAGASRGRRLLWPALAVAAALLLALGARAVPGEGPAADRPVLAHTHRPAPPVVAALPAPVVLPPTPPISPADDEPVAVGSASGAEGGADVTHMDVVGAQSYAVLQIPGVSPGTLTAVVWIDDKPDTDPPETAVQ